MAGLPDIIGCVQGRFIGIEVKRPERIDRVTPLQQAILDEITRNGGLAFVASDPQSVIEKIQTFLNSN